jgi:hypothetical protein
MKYLAIEPSECLYFSTFVVSKLFYLALQKFPIDSTNKFFCFIKKLGLILNFIQKCATYKWKLHKISLK